MTVFVVVPRCKLKNKALETLVFPSGGPQNKRIPVYPEDPIYTCFFPSVADTITVPNCL